MELLHKRLGHPLFATLDKLDKTIWDSINFSIPLLALFVFKINKHKILFL